MSLALRTTERYKSIINGLPIEYEKNCYAFLQISIYESVAFLLLYIIYIGIVVTITRYQRFKQDQLVALADATDTEPLLYDPVFFIV